MPSIPPNNTCFFEFTNSGYITPKFDAVNFDFSVNMPTMSEIKATIVGMELERDYLKSCEDYIVGFDQDNLQIIRHSCIYGGIRDLLAYALVLSNFRELTLYIKQIYTGQADILLGLRGTSSVKENLPIAIKGRLQAYVDLSTSLIRGYSDQFDLFEYLKSFYIQQSNLINTVKGCSIGNVIDLLNAVKCGQSIIVDVPIYLKSGFPQVLDLPTSVYKIWDRGIEVIDFILHGWQEVQLQKIIQAFHTTDLNILLRSTYLVNLGLVLAAIQPVDIPVGLFGWAIQDLNAYVVDGVYAGDLSFYLTTIPPIDLNGIIHVMRGINIPIDLTARILNSPFSELYIGITGISYRDLNAYLLSSSDYFDLQVKIYPKYVNVKHHIMVSFLEYKDLVGIINFPCFGSAYRDLFFSLAIKNSKDIAAYIYAYDCSNIKDLGCFINSVGYVTQNTIDIAYFHGQRFLPFSNTKLSYKNKEVIYSVNKITLWNNSLLRSIANLGFSVVGDYVIKDLGAQIKVYSNIHYRPTAFKERFVTLQLKDNREVFRRYVELTFNSYVSGYTYFSGNQKAYRDYKDEHWIVRVEGYEALPIGFGFEKAKVRRKYIFNLKNYLSLDDAIKDMIHRVTSMQHTNLSAYIESAYDKVTNLPCSLNARHIYKSNRVIGATIVVREGILVDLALSILGLTNEDTKDLSASINGTEYITPIAGVVDFDFMGAGDFIPNPGNASFVFDMGAMNGSN